MLRKVHFLSIALVGILSLGVSLQDGVAAGLKKGNPNLKSVGPLAFGPGGILFVGDSQSAAVFAIDTGDAPEERSKSKLNVEGIREKIADLLGTRVKRIRINDLAVNPASGNAYLSVSRGAGPKAQPVLLRVESSGKISEVSLKDVAFAKASLSNAPEDKVVGRGRRKRNLRRESITDIAFLDGKVIVAGLSNEEFASKLRSIPYPFVETDPGASVEIFHASHGRFETRSPVRTFAPITIAGEQHLLAAYTCTPLVRFPISQLKTGSKVRGITVAELGNHNRPLDMIVYQKAGKTYLLMANNKRGVMKIDAENIDKTATLTKRVRDTAGQSYETIDHLKGVVQLDRLDDEHALILVETKSKAMNLQTVPLP